MLEHTRALEAACAESDEAQAVQRAAIAALEKQLRDAERRRADDAAEAARAAALAQGAAVSAVLQLARSAHINPILCCFCA